MEEPLPISSVTDSSAVDLERLVRHSLERQADLSAVDRFARRHDEGELAPSGRYRDLLPAAALRSGEQFAFEVNLDSCTGCKSCVVACHNLNGLDPDETWREVGLLVGGSSNIPLLQHVTSACHHCLEPACLEGCPVGAYEKDSLTGIVRHLDDQCIGCQYCTLTCPYDVPKYNERLGIVRKCDLCTGRLATGEAPACAEACPTGAIRVVAIDTGAVARAAETGTFLPGAPDPRLTLPTTRYVRREAIPDDAAPADDHQVRPERAHPALVAMLVLTQLSVGALAVGQAIEVIVPGALSAVRPIHGALSVGAGLVALAVSILHLGRPLYAWKAVLGFRTSWLSREVLAFGLFAALAIADFVVEVVSPASAAGHALGLGAVASGAAGIACSVMLYDRTRRPFWHWTRNAWKFALSAAALGIATTLVAMAIGGGAIGAPLMAALAGVVALKLSLELVVFRHLPSRGERGRTPMARTAMLLRGDLRRTTTARFVAGAIGGVALPLFLLFLEATPAIVATLLILAMTLAAEALERDLFFRAVTVPRSPAGAET